MGYVASALVRILHIGVIFYIVFGPYIKRYCSPQLVRPIWKATSLSIYDVLYLTSATALLIHWYAGSDICVLGVLEGYATGQHYTKGFIHRLVSPIYNVPQLGSQISRLSYVIVIFNCIMVLRKSRFGVL